MEKIRTRNVVSTEVSIEGQRNGWTTGRDRNFQTHPLKTEDGIVHVMLIDNADFKHEGDMPAQYVVTRETCSCGQLFCSHRAYVIAMNDQMHVPVGRFKTLGGRGVNVKEDKM